MPFVPMASLLGMLGAGIQLKYFGPTPLSSPSML